MTLPASFTRISSVALLGLANAVPPLAQTNEPAPAPPATAPASAPATNATASTNSPSPLATNEVAPAPAVAPPAAPDKPKIGIMKFEVSKALDATLSSLLYDVLTEQVVKSGRFIVVDWEQIDRVLQYVAKSQPNLSPEDARRQAVNQLGIQKLYLGSAAKLGTKHFLSVKVLNLNLSVDAVETESVDNEEQMVDALARITAKLLGLPPPAIKPAPVPETKPVPLGPQNATKEQPWTNSLGMKFVPVPGTKVLFCIWETRVKDYAAFAKATERKIEKPDFTQGPTHPAVNVSWNEAVLFCEWLTTKEQTEGVISADDSYRLPTDREWSAAVGLPEEAGATPQERDGRIKGVYPWGNEFPPPGWAGNYAGDSDGFPNSAPVGSFRPNQYGLCDLGGNVWEWCEDWYNNERKSRVLRGGSWGNSAPDILLSSYRVSRTPDLRNDLYGFRVVLVVGSSR